jgi:hypothetical protein
MLFARGIKNVTHTRSLAWWRGQKSKGIKCALLGEERFASVADIVGGEHANRISAMTFYGH